MNSALPLPDVLSNTEKEAVPAVVIEIRHNLPIPTLIVVVEDPLAIKVLNWPPELARVSPIRDACICVLSK
jgi:hypothetical protein